MSKESTPVDILDQVKQAEANARKHLLIKRVSDLKKLCKRVFEVKKECEIIMSEAGVTEEDAKRIIDYINSLPDIQLNEDDIKVIREKVKTKNKEVKEEIKKEVEKYPSVMFMAASGTTSTPVYQPTGNGTRYDNVSTTSYTSALSSDSKLNTLLDKAIVM